MAATIKSLPGEIWKPVVGWEGFYEVSDLGNVASVERTVVRVKQEMPYDQCDLDACERMFAKLPAHRKTPAVVRDMERARKAVERVED